MSRRGGVGADLQLHDLHPPLGEAVALEEGGELEQVVDLPGGGHLGVDGHGEAQLVLEEVELAGVLGAAHPGDGVDIGHLVGHHAAQEVDLVAAGGGDEKIGGVDARLL